MADNVTSLQIKVVSDQVSAAEKRLTALETAAGKAEKQNEKLGKSAVSMGDSFKKAGMVANAALAVVGIGAIGLATSVGTATQAWLEYDKAIKSVNSIAGLSSAKFKALRKDTLLLASALGVDATEAAKGLFDTFQADIPEADALSFLAAASKLAIGGGTTTSTAVNSITNVMKAYNLEASRATEISDKLFTTVLFGKAEFEGLGSALAGATVPGAALGVQFEEILAMITTITAQGTSTSEAVTQIERSMQALLNPSEEMVAVFKQLNVEGGRQAITQFGLVGTLEKVRQAYVGNDAAMVKALGSVVAFAAAVGTTGDKLEDSKKSFDQVTNSAGRTATAFATNSNTLQSSLASVKSSVVLLVEQMEGSLGVIAAFSEALRGAAQMMNAVASGQMTLSANAANALNLGGSAMGYAKTTEQLKALNDEQQKLISKGASLEKLKAQRNSFGVLPELFSWDAAANARLESINKEMEILNRNLATMPEEAKKMGTAVVGFSQLDAQLKAGTISTAQHAEQMAKLRGEAMSYKKATEDQVELEKEKASVIKKAREEQDKASAARFKAAEETLKKQEEEKKVMKEAGDLAKDLATTDRERIQLKQTLVDKAVAAGTATAAEGAEAKAALQEQLKLLDERDAKKASAGGGGAGGMSATTFSEFERGLPELAGSNYGETEFDRLKKEEEMLEASLMERQLAIEEAAAKQIITEEQKFAMLAKTQSQYTNMQRQMELERNRLMVTGVADLFGNLAEIAGVFGKKGAKAAKALAIVQATVKMYESATSAYASAAAIPYYGFIAAPIAAGAALAAGAVNIAAIKNQDENIGAYEHGGMIPSGKMGIVGEAGAELVKGPAMVTSARTTAGFIGGGSSEKPEVNISIINNTSEKIEKRTSKDGDKEMIEFIIGQASDRVAEKISKGGNSISKALENRYNLGRGK